MFMQNTEETFLRCKCTGNCNVVRAGDERGRGRGRAVNIHSGRGKFESNIRKRGIKSITLPRVLSLSILVDSHSIFAQQPYRFDPISDIDLVHQTIFDRLCPSLSFLFVFVNILLKQKVSSIKKKDILNTS